MHIRRTQNPMRLFILDGDRDTNMLVTQPQRNICQQCAKGDMYHCTKISKSYTLTQKYALSENTNKLNWFWAIRIEGVLVVTSLFTFFLPHRMLAYLQSFVLCHLHMKGCSGRLNVEMWNTTRPVTSVVFTSLQQKEENALGVLEGSDADRESAPTD